MHRVERFLLRCVERTLKRIVRAESEHDVVHQPAIEQAAQICQQAVFNRVWRGRNPSNFCDRRGTRSVARLTARPSTDWTRRH